MRNLSYQSGNPYVFENIVLFNIMRHSNILKGDCAMKKSVLLMSMALALTAFGSDMQIAKAAEETASKEEIKVEDLVGSYTAIATYNSGYYVSIEATGMDSILEVRDDGTGAMAYFSWDDPEELTWEIENDYLVLSDGILEYVTFCEPDILSYCMSYDTSIII